MSKITDNLLEKLMESKHFFGKEEQEIIESVKRDNEVYAMIAIISCRLMGMDKMQTLASAIAMSKVGKNMEVEADVLLMMLVECTKKYLSMENKLRK